MIGTVHPFVKLLAWVALGVVGWLVLIAYVALWLMWPFGASLVTAGAAGFMGGLAVRDRRRKTTAVVAEMLGEEVEAIHLADFDADVLAERVARTTDKHAIPEPEPWALDGSQPPKRYPERCDNCGDLAVYAVNEGDGNYCSYACEACIELRMPDGFDPSMAVRIAAEVVE